MPDQKMVIWLISTDLKTEEKVEIYLACDVESSQGKITGAC